MTVRRLAAIGVLAGLLVTATLFGLSRQQTAAGAPVDITGEWSLQLYQLACHANLAQSERDVTGEALCGDVLRLEFAGVIDPDSGRFAMCADEGGVRLCLDGTASNSSMSGTAREASGSYPFAGARIFPTPTPTPIPPLDLSGNWLLTLQTYNFPNAGSPMNCPVYLEEADSQVSGAVACNPISTVRISGSVDHDSDSFTLSWTMPIGSFTLNGSRGSGSALGGTYAVSFSDVTDTFSIGSWFESWWGAPVCFTSPPVGPPGPAPSPVVNRSVAALNALQLSAKMGWRDSQCQYILDVNVDGHVDALDAVLILQREAGLVPRLPVL